jgi:alpha-N-arabinofuranosidase
MRVKFVVPALAAALAFCLPASAQRPPAPVNVSVAIDTAHPGARIEPTIYGQFAEHLGRGIYEGVWVGENSPIPNTNGYRNDVLAALRRLHVPVIRWPGGCFADEYDWRDGIGPRDRRPARINRYWGGVIETNAFGTHEYLNFVELLGADAFVSGNMGSMTPRAMGQWFEYMTATTPTALVQERRRNGRDRPWRVRYFGFGNESWGCGGNMRPEYQADLHRRYQTFIANPPGVPPVVRVASGSHDSDYNFTEVMMREAAQHMDAISLHYYTLPGTWEHKGPALGFSENEWATTLAHAVRIDDYITRHSAIMDRYDPQRRVALFVDEWGTWYDQEQGSTPGFLYQQNSLRDAVVAALTLDIFHRHTDRVKLAAIAQMVNVLQAMILTDGPRMLLTPTYHVFDMYQPFRGATPYPATVEGPRYRLDGNDLPMVDISAARGADGRLYLALVNLDPNRAAHVTTALTGRAGGQILTGPAMDTHNTFDAPNTLHPIPYSGSNAGGRLSFELPARSVAVVAVQ